MSVPKVGDVFWIIKGTVESACYADFNAVPPRRMKLVREQGGPDLFYASRLKQDGTVDNDTNASCFVRPQDCHGTLKEATAAYVESLANRCQRIEQELEEAAYEHDEWKNRLEAMEESPNGRT